jgi:hypothetical protein
MRGHLQVEFQHPRGQDSERREWLTVLAALVMGTSATPPASRDWLTFALRRHGIGPRQLPQEITGRLCREDQDHLARIQQNIVRRRALESALLMRIAEKFSDRKIGWMVLKGAPLVAQIYGDAAWRSSSDIDLLVAPSDFAKALSVFGELGWSSIYVPGWRTNLALRLIRDIGLKGPGGFYIELHQRPLFGEAFVKTGAALLASSCAPPIPAPTLNPVLLWYLMAHGALCYWVRFKWLADFTKALEISDIATQAGLLSEAENRCTTITLAASLLFAAQYFPSRLPAPLLDWAKPFAKKSAHRIARYKAALEADDAQSQSPLGNRWMSLEAQWLLYESPIDRSFVLSSSAAVLVLRKFAGMERRRGHSKPVP